MFREFHYQVRGHGHVRDGTPVQDRTKYLSRGGVQALCLADGAGSAALSQFGAQGVVDEGTRIMVENFEDFCASTDGAEVKSVVARRLLDKLSAIAARHGCELADLASTFLCVAVSGNKFIGAHVGDGVVGYVKNGDLRVVTAPDNAEFANQTTFVTSRDAVSSMRLFRGSLDGVAGFVLMSDGAGESLFDPRTGQLAAACTKLISAVGSAPAQQGKNSRYKKQLRKLVDVQIRDATKDDCAIGILSRAGGR